MNKARHDIIAEYAHDRRCISKDSLKNLVLELTLNMEYLLRDSAANEVMRSDWSGH